MKRPTSVAAGDLDGEPLERYYIPLPVAEALSWRENPKQHDLGKIADSIEQHGFRDPPSFDGKLININGEPGAIVEGNGRIETLAWMKKQGRAAPRGILTHPKTGDWYVPILFGLDAQSEWAATAYAVDHNSLVMAGSDLQNFEQWRIYDEARLKDLFAAMPTMPSVAFLADDIADLFADKPGKSDGGDNEMCICPTCGKEHHAG